MAVGYARARGPWARYRALRDQQANIDRYEAWRGGLRADEDGPTGASVDDGGGAPPGTGRRHHRRIVGVVLVILGFLIR